MEKYSAFFEKNINQKQETPVSFSLEKLKEEIFSETHRLFDEEFTNFRVPQQFKTLLSQNTPESKKILTDLLLTHIDLWQKEFLDNHNSQFDDDEEQKNEESLTQINENEIREITKDKLYEYNEEIGSSVAPSLFESFEDFRTEIIKTMGDSQDTYFASSLINFVKNQQINAPQYIEKITYSLKKINSPESTSSLLALAQSSDSIERRIALGILYRLEDRQIGVTEEGLQYLQKRFDLGEEYNNKKYFGQRITNSGQVGIFESSNNKLLKYFNSGNFASQDLTTKAKLLDITYSTLFTPLPGETAEEKKEREDFLEHFQESYNDFFHNDFFKESSFHFNDLSFPEQSAFLRLYENATEKNKHDLEVFARTYGLSGFRSLLAMGADNNIATGEMVINLGQQLAPQDANIIFSEFNNLIENTNLTSAETIEQLSQEYPELNITEEHIRYALLARGRDYFKEISKQLSQHPENKHEIIKEYSQELRSEKISTTFFRAEFKTIAELLNRKNINLETLSTEQSALLKNFSNTGYKQVAFRALARMDKLEPIPEIHWEIDRGPEEYNRRLGIHVGNVLENLQEFPLTGEPKILLEIGPGSGAHKYSRQQNKGYEDYGLSDRIYYPLAPLIEKLIDFDTLEKDINQTLSSDERKKLADFIYKILVIQEGQTTQDNFSYDDEVQQLLQKDINNLKKILPKIASCLKETNSVPETISSRDEEGRVIYPNKISVETLSPSLQTVKKNLDNNFTNYLVKDWENKDYFSLIDAFPANVMIGDIKDIDRLANNQIDVELAVRSTVYSRHEDYEKFLTILVEKLKTGGVAIDDSIRDNDGWYYRFAEIIKAREQFKNETEILVILGPGFPGEDYQQDRVPLSMIITIEAYSKELIASQLEPNCEVVTFDELTNDEKYLASLDNTGLTYTRAQTAKITISSVAA